MRKIEIIELPVTYCDLCEARIDGHWMDIPEGRKIPAETPEGETYFVGPKDICWACCEKIWPEKYAYKPPKKRRGRKSNVA